MPHDRLGSELKAGDRVLVPCIVTRIDANPDYCNMQLVTEEPMHPGEHKSTITLNCRQVVKALEQMPASPAEQAMAGT